MLPWCSCWCWCWCWYCRAWWPAFGCAVANALHLLVLGLEHLLEVEIELPLLLDALLLDVADYALVHRLGSGLLACLP